MQKRRGRHKKYVEVAGIKHNGEETEDRSSPYYIDKAKSVA
jgi:hypothetical protein